MGALIYIKEIRPDSFLHLSTKRYGNDESFAIRDFAYDDSPILTQSTSSYSAEELRALATKKPGNFYIANIPHRSVSEVLFWQQEIERQNQKYGIAAQQSIVNSQSTEQQTFYKEESKQQPIISEQYFEQDIKISAQEQELLDKFRRLSLAKQALVVNLIDNLLS